MKAIIMVSLIVLCAITNSAHAMDPVQRRMQEQAQQQRQEQINRDAAQQLTFAQNNKTLAMIPHQASHQYQAQAFQHNNLYARK